MWRVGVRVSDTESAEKNICSYRMRSGRCMTDGMCMRGQQKLLRGEICFRCNDCGFGRMCAAFLDLLIFVELYSFMYVLAAVFGAGIGGFRAAFFASFLFLMR